MCHQPRSIKAEEGESEEVGAECGALQEVLGGGLREECDREECDVPGLLVEVQQYDGNALASILNDTLNEQCLNSGETLAIQVNSSRDTLAAAICWLLLRLALFTPPRYKGFRSAHMLHVTVP